ncbi:MAG: nuclear transport factor 2 family protein [Mesorhizobium sp.]|nr:MAG: nuclear transport factor 2 family protein [Mesorhizobium sp.]TIT11069.1 MAG: nuclear transport factor 2 family protein [Mesorhizobium sp.]TIU41200.1 MAG: nuclear transport factor 2 family protein [Mesorhizobium sp.]TIU44507.1 MAG: nuclear transport factor 2 family protein [Mesorhizobium sp.]TIV11300.1 MAG: nuclear transport factor 2 family protein [Mesorhizobium sp.]
MLGANTKTSEDLIMAIDSLERRWDAYLAAYGPIAAAERERLLKQSVSDDVVFTNPGGEGKTRNGLIAHIEDFQKKMPGTFFKTDKVFVHHGELLAIWSMYKSDDTKVATGYNFVRPNKDYRFSYMAGFF